MAKRRGGGYNRGNAFRRPGNAMEAIFLFGAGCLLIIAVVVVVRLIAGEKNRERIRKKLYELGGEVLDIEWEPFGPGWFGNQDQAIYRVRYRDREGDVHEVHCQTSMFADVYFTDDRLLAPPRESRTSESGEGQRLRAENQRLRREVERLRGEAEERRRNAGNRRLGGQ